MEADMEMEEGEDRKREGTVWTATAHIVTAIIGSGVLSLAWSVSQLGWIAGPLALLAFASATCYTATLLAACYRSSDGCATRNPTYMDAVKSYLGSREVVLCGVAQYINLWGTLVGYTITATGSLTSIRKVECLRQEGESVSECEDAASGSLLMIGFGVVEVVLSQLPSLDKVAWLSMAAAAMSFAYFFISLGLCIARLAAHGGVIRGNLVGSTGLSPIMKTWNSLLALGNIAFACTFAEVSIEIQDTLKPHPPEVVVMKRAAVCGIGLTTALYLSLGCVGYAALGSEVPGNILSISGSYAPFWLVDIANACVLLHLIGAYQVYAQPFFAAIERWIVSHWPHNKFVDTEFAVRVPLIKNGQLNFSVIKLVVRSALVVLTTLVAMLLPFFNAILGLLGAVSFWPLTIYFPVRMHIVQAKIRRGTARWLTLQSLIAFCLVVSVAVAIGSMTDIVKSLKVSTPFKL